VEPQLRADRRSAGFSTASTAPSASARVVATVPAPVSVETITTGVGRVRMSSARPSRPLRRGISTSRVMTSGWSAVAFSTSSTPSRASPATVMPPSVSMSDSTRRSSGESSQIRTRGEAGTGPLLRD
jgi:hypothetical protein